MPLMYFHIVAGSTTSTPNMHHKYVPSNATDEGGFFPPATKEVAVWYQPNISTALKVLSSAPSTFNGRARKDINNFRAATEAPRKRLNFISQ